MTRYWDDCGVLAETKTSNNKTKTIQCFNCIFTSVISDLNTCGHVSPQSSLWGYSTRGHSPALSRGVTTAFHIVFTDFEGDSKKLPSLNWADLGKASAVGSLGASTGNAQSQDCPPVLLKWHTCRAASSVQTDWHTTNKTKPQNTLWYCRH